MPCPDDVCDTPPSLAIDPVITRIGNELLSLVRDAQQHRDQQQGTQLGGITQHTSIAAQATTQIHCTETYAKGAMLTTMPHAMLSSAVLVLQATSSSTPAATY